MFVKEVWSWSTFSVFSDKIYFNIFRMKEYLPHGGGSCDIHSGTCHISGSFSRYLVNLQIQVTQRYVLYTPYTVGVIAATIGIPVKHRQRQLYWVELEAGRLVNKMKTRISAVAV